MTQSSFQLQPLDLFPRSKPVEHFLIVGICPLSGSDDSLYEDSCGLHSWPCRLKCACGIFLTSVPPDANWILYNWCAVNDTCRRALWTSGTWIPRRSGSTENNPPWSMECFCVHAAGSHEDRTSVDSPVVLSSFVSQLELECIGGITTLSWADKQVSFFLFFFNDTKLCFFFLQMEVQEIMT